MRACVRAEVSVSQPDVAMIAADDEARVRAEALARIAGSAISILCIARVFIFYLHAVFSCCGEREGKTQKEQGGGMERREGIGAGLLGFQTNKMERST